MLASGFSYTQIQICNLSTGPNSTPILYYNHQNTMCVLDLEYDSTILLTSLNDTFNWQNNYFSYYKYQSDNQKYDTLKIIKNGQIIYQQAFKLEQLGPPQFYLGNIRDTFVTVQEILLNPRLIISYEPQVYIPCIHIMDYVAVILKKNGRTIKMPEEKKINIHRWSEEKWLRKVQIFNERLAKRGEQADQWGLRMKKKSYV